ncbi:MAG: glucosaminidase domain-containing protein [Halofilum sp. (in: g-proteobacteria)]
MMSNETGWRGAVAFLSDHRPLVVVCLVAALVVVFAVAGPLLVAPPEPGARNVADLPEPKKEQQLPTKKQAFFDFLRPVVRAENDRVRAQREHLDGLIERLEAGESLSAGDREWLARMAKRYRVKAEEPMARARALTARIDIIPVSLALAQAALESAWGQSRFAREANNLFGEWCFEPGCGVVPKRRPAGKTYEVEAFDGVGGSVRSYIHNLNSHPAYAKLREIRAQARAEGKTPDGYAMAAGLVNYAAIGEQYVQHIRSVIERNGLRRQPG